MNRFLHAALAVSLCMVLCAGVSRKAELKDLKSEDMEARGRAFAALRQLSPAEAADVMASFSNDADPEVRILMVQMMGELGEASIDHLMRLYGKEKSSRVRRAQMVQLAGLLQNPYDKLAFFGAAALKDNASDLRLLALVEMSLLTSVPEVKRDLEPALKKIRRKDPLRSHQVFATVLLAEMGEKSKDLASALEEAAASESVEIRRRVAGLGKTLVENQPRERAVEQLRRLSADVDAEVRSAVARSLEEVRDAELLPALQSLWSDRNGAVRRLALQSAGQWDRAAIGTQPFANGLTDEEASVRALCARELEHAKDLSVLPLLRDLADNDPDAEVRRLARQAALTLSDLAPPEAPQ